MANGKPAVRKVEGPFAYWALVLKDFAQAWLAYGILAVVIAGKTGPLSLWGAGLYVLCRALYVPIYAAGTYMLRSLVWTLALVGLGMVVAALFLA